MNNISVPKEDLDLIRKLSDFDLIMLLSEINDHGWNEAQKTWEIMKDVLKDELNRKNEAS